MDGDPIRYADAVVIAPDGLMYFTDASRRFAAKEWGTFKAALLDIIEHSCTGRVLVYDPGRRSTSLVIGGLCFPNGVALSGDGQHLFVAETGEYRIWKVAAAARGVDARGLASTDGAEARVIAANLPGFPDNLTRSADGRLWTGLTKPRSAVIDGMAGQPLLRAVTLRLPRSMWPVPPVYGHVSYSMRTAGSWPTCRTPPGRVRRDERGHRDGGAALRPQPARRRVRGHRRRGAGCRGSLRRKGASGQRRVSGRRASPSSRRSARS